MILISLAKSNQQRAALCYKVQTSFLWLLTVHPRAINSSMTFYGSCTENCNRNGLASMCPSTLQVLKFVAETIGSFAGICPSTLSSSFGEQWKFDEMPRRIFRLDCEYIMLPLMPASVQVMLMFPWCMGLLFPAHAWWIILLWPAGFSSAKNPFYFSCLLTGLRLVHAGIGITEESSKSFAAKLSCRASTPNCSCLRVAQGELLMLQHCPCQRSDSEPLPETRA